MSTEEINTDYTAMIDSLLRRTGASIKFKNESKFITFLNIFVRLFNKRFLTDYVNVIGYTIWFPSREYYEKADKRWLYCFLCHECHHVDSTSEQGILGIILSYGFPQSLVMFTIPAIIACSVVFGVSFCPVLILLGVSVLCLVPWPAYWRVKEEVSAELCEETAKERVGLPSNKENLFNNVCSWEYYNPMFKLEWARKMFDKQKETKRAIGCILVDVPQKQNEAQKQENSLSK